jgi:nucleotide-binding universal stress UspA family protein
MFKKILVAVDGSAANERILLFAEHVARLEEASLVVLHAYRLPQEYEWTVAYEAIRGHFESMAAEVVSDALEVLEAAGATAESEVREGAAAEAILGAARAHTADLIVMGSRAAGRASIPEALLGSVSATVLRYAGCPVLIVP